VPRVPFAPSSRSQLLQRNWLDLTLARPGRGSQPLSTGSGRQRSPHDLLDVRSPQDMVTVSQGILKVLGSASNCAVVLNFANIMGLEFMW